MIAYRDKAVKISFFLVIFICLCLMIYSHNPNYGDNVAVVAKNRVFHHFISNQSLGYIVPRLGPNGQKLLISQQYTISPDSCKRLPVHPFLLVIATSRVNGFKIRHAIRETWASVAGTNCEVRILFMIGRASDAKLQRKVEKEADKYNDLIQSNQFDDTYSTAAAKSLHLLQWAHTFCPHSVYTAKIDDDNWLNLPKYLQFLKSQQNTDFAFGALFGTGSGVIRDPSHKNYVSREDYKEDYYPDYMSGMLYAFPTRFLGKLLKASREIPKIINEDVYICGLLAGRANITRRRAPDYAWSHDIRDTNCPKRDKTCIHYSRIEDFYKLWNDDCYEYDTLC